MYNAVIFRRGYNVRSQTSTAGDAGTGAGLPPVAGVDGDGVPVVPPVAGVSLDGRPQQGRRCHRWRVSGSRQGRRCLSRWFRCQQREGRRRSYRQGRRCHRWRVSLSRQPARGRRCHRWRPLQRGRRVSLSRCQQRGRHGGDGRGAVSFSLWRVFPSLAVSL